MQNKEKFMDRYSYLLKNIGLLTIGNFSTKILSFFMVPLYTNVLTTTDYGNYDLISTTVTLLIPIFTLNIMDGTLRYSLDNELNKTSVFTISLQYYVKAVLGIIFLLTVNYFTNFIPILNTYRLFLFFQFILIAFSGILSSFSRGIDKVKEVSISGILGSFVCIILNLIFLLFIKIGLIGYFWANIGGVLAQVLYLFIVIKAWNYINLKKLDIDIKEKMLSYSIPLIANNIAWWINNVSDRYIITWICGVALNGIYSVSYKIPSILSILQSIFQQAWTLSAVKDYSSQDRDEYFTKIYNMLNYILISKIGRAHV